MLLAIDTGNTNVKFALVDDTGEILQRWRIATDARRTSDEYAVWLDQLIQMAGFHRTDIKAVIIATVVPRALHNLQLLATRYFGCEALVAGRDSVGWGIQLHVAEPHSVGADRAVNAIAAQSMADGHKVVISFGTATTFDYIGPDGSYRGAASRLALTYHSMPYMPQPPCCRELQLNHHQMKAFLAQRLLDKCRLASIGAMWR